MSVINFTRVDPDDSESEDCYPMFENFRRGDHIITDINIEGTTDKTFYRPNFWVGRRHVEEWAAPGPGDIGTYVTNDDDAMATFHMIRTHSINEGWRADDEVHVYELLSSTLDEIWEKHEDSIIRPMRIWLPGWRGCNVDVDKAPKILGDVKWVENMMWEALTNTSCELDVWMM